jgi:hypothetical protein
LRRKPRRGRGRSGSAAPESPVFAAPGRQKGAQIFFKKTAWDPLTNFAGLGNLPYYFTLEEIVFNANDQSVDPRGPAEFPLKDEIAGADELPAEAGGVYQGYDDYPQEAEFGFAEGGARAPDKRYGSDGVYSRHRA